MVAKAVESMLSGAQSDAAALGHDDAVLAGLVHSEFDSDDLSSLPAVALAACLLSEALQIAHESQ